MSHSTGRPVPATRVCMLVKNSFEFDARVDREARSLLEHGYEVTVVALRSATTPPIERRGDGLRIVRIGAGRRRAGGLLPPSTARAGAAVRDPRRGHGAMLVRLVRRIVGALLNLGGPLARPVRELIRDRAMVRAARSTHADVFHAHDLNTLHLAVRCARGTSAAVLYDAHELHSARARDTPRQRRRAREREASLLPHAAAVLTASPGYSRHMANEYGIEPPRVVLNAPEYVDGVDPVDLRELLDIEDAHRIVLYQGSIQEHRGLEQLVTAIEQLDTVTLVIVGYGHHRPALERLVDARGLRNRVRFAGAVPHEELLRYSAGADVGACCIVGVSLSYELSMPNKLFEYTMARLPILVSDYDHMGGFVREHRLGVTCDPTDPCSVADSLSRLLDDEVLYPECRNNADRAARAFCWEVQSRPLLATYADLQTHQRDREDGS